MYQILVAWIFVFFAPFMQETAWGSPHAAQPHLTVYTTRSFASGVGEDAKALFEKKYGCNVEYVYCSGTFSTLSQVKSTHDKGDLIVGFTYESFLENEEDLSRLFYPYPTPKKTELPLNWESSYLTPISYTFLSFIYDSRKIKEKIESFEDLLKIQSKIILIDPRTSSPGLGLLLWVKAVYGDQAPSFWKRLKPQILTFTKSWSEAYALFLQGEAPLVLSYSASPAYHRLIQKKDYIHASFFKEGQYLQVYVAGILQNSKNKKWAEMFLDLLLSQEIQKKVIYKDWSYPVMDINEELPVEFQRKNNKDIEIDYRTLMKEKKNILRQWLDAIS